MDSTSLAEVPVGLVFPLVSVSMQHFVKEACLTGQHIRFLEELNIKHAPLAGAFMSCGGSEGKMTLITNKPFACVFRSGL